MTHVPKVNLKSFYLAPIMNELRNNPQKHLQLILDIAIDNIGKEKDTEKILWLAEQLGVKK